MIPFHLTILLPGIDSPQTLLIWADHQVIDEHDQIQFFDSDDNPVATVPVAIIQITPEDL